MLELCQIARDWNNYRIWNNLRSMPLGLLHLPSHDLGIQLFLPLVVWHIVSCAVVDLRYPAHVNSPALEYIPKSRPLSWRVSATYFMPLGNFAESARQCPVSSRCSSAQQSSSTTYWYPRSRRPVSTNSWEVSSTRSSETSQYVEYQLFWSIWITRLSIMLWGLLSELTHPS